MKTIWMLSVVFLTTTACGSSPSPSAGKPEGASAPPKVIVEREKVERAPLPPPEVKIKLKRDGKENYSWELNSSDVDQVLKVNEKIRKQLDGEKSTDVGRK
jgi:hypothetical protein